MSERTLLQVLIVDDEQLARMRLRSLVETCSEPPCQVVGEAEDADEALRVLAQMPCDVVLLDIAMPGRDGLKLADELRRQPAPPMVVFITAHADHALRAFEVDATDYLTKPVRRERLQAALMRVDERRANRAEVAPSGPVLVVSDRGRVLRVPATEVLYLKAEQKYVSLCSTRGRWVLDDALSDLEQRLGEGFLRIHRSSLVRTASVTQARLSGAEPTVSVGDLALPVSRRMVPAVREALVRREGGG